MSAIEIREISSLLMLVPLVIVLGMGAFFVSLLVHWARQRKAQNRFADPELPNGLSMPPPDFRPLLLDQPRRWIAIKGSTPVAVQEALHLHHPTPCSWEEGLVEAREEDRLFISPPVNGWILVMGFGLPDPGEDVDQCFHCLTDLSRKLGHVQFFNANRALNHHAWALLEKGRVLRAYAWSGETVWNQGQLTAAEKDLKVCCFDYGSDRIDFVQRDSLFANSEKVVRLAAVWSVDPTAIDDRALRAYGIAGAPSQIRPH